MLEITFKYYRIFRLSVFHNYFAANRSNDFILRPTKRTLAFCQRAGFNIRGDQNGIFVFYDGTRGDSLISYLTNFQPVVFSFWLECQNSYFRNFTNLDHEARNGLFYFSNRQTTLLPEEEILLLHDEENVTDRRYFKKRPSAFTWQTSSADAEIQLQNEQGEVIQKGQAFEGIYQTNIPEPWEGLYTIQEDGEEKEQFVFGGVDHSIRTLGLVNIFFDGKEKDDYIEKVSSGEFPTPTNYAIQFKNRSTYWRYYVVSRYNGQLKDLSISSSEGQPAFLEPQNVQLLNGEDAMLFECEQELPLQERSEVHFQLRKSKGGNEGRIILNRLPVPSVETIKPQSRERDSKIFSDIIVYI